MATLNVDQIIADLAKVYYDNTWANVPGALMAKPYGPALMQAIGGDIANLMNELPIKKDGQPVSQSALDAYKTKYASIFTAATAAKAVVKSTGVSDAELALLKTMYWKQHWDKINAAVSASAYLTELKAKIEVWGVAFADFVSVIPIDKKGKRLPEWDQFHTDFAPVLIYGSNVSAAGQAAIKASPATTAPAVNAAIDAATTKALAALAAQLAKQGVAPAAIAQMLPQAAQQMQAQAAQPSTMMIQVPQATAAPAAVVAQAGIPEWVWIAGGAAAVLAIGVVISMRKR
jgi:protein-disulfide isomerase-like protein with CxxC motif